MSCPITIVYHGSKSRLIDAIANAITILNSGSLHALIENREKQFFNSIRPCKDIAKALAECNVEITLREFTKAAQNGRITTAYVKPAVRDTIYYNTKVMDNSIRSQTNTLVHEAIHIIDYFHDTVSGGGDFTHQGNDPYDPIGNLDSAPYWIGDRAEDLVDLLDDHVGQQKGFYSLDSVDLELVRNYVTEEAWSARKGFICGTELLA